MAGAAVWAQGPRLDGVVELEGGAEAEVDAQKDLPAVAGAAFEEAQLAAVQAKNMAEVDTVETAFGEPKEGLELIAVENKRALTVEGAWKQDTAAACIVGLTCNLQEVAVAGVLHLSLCKAEAYNWMRVA